MWLPNNASAIRPTSGRRFGILGLIAILTVAVVGQSDDSSPPKSGPPIGSEVNSFYVRAVTGPLAGKSVCYVCRNGDRPVVIVILRDLNSDAAKLLKQLDATVNEHRAQGLRCFAVLVTESAQKDSARLQTLAFDEKLDLPLTIAGEAMTGSILANFSPEAPVCVVLYDDLKVIDRFSFRTNECNEAARTTVIDAVKMLARRSGK